METRLSAGDKKAARQRQNFIAGEGLPMFSTTPSR